MKAFEKIMAIYDMAYSNQRWSNGLDALLHGSKAKHLLVYDTGDRRAISYNRQTGDSAFLEQKSLMEDYNSLISEKGGSSLDAEGSVIIHAEAAFKTVLDEHIWKIDSLHEERAEIKFTIDRLEVFRRFYINLSEDPQTYAGLIVLYPKHLRDTPPPSDQRLFESFAPHLGKAMEIHRINESLRQKFNAVLAVLDMVATPICIVDAKSRVLLKNKSASDLFTDKNGIWTDRTGRLVCSFENNEQRLKDAVFRTASTASGNGDDSQIELKLERRAGRIPLVAVASPLRDAEMELEQGLNGTLLTIIDGSSASMVDTTRLAWAYGLTGAESRLLPHVIRGMSNRECAERLEVQPETVKTQIASILAKTQCLNRVALVWRAYAFSPSLR